MLTKYEKDNLSAAFEYIDKNRDGVLSKEEIKQGKLTPPPLILVYDKNGSLLSLEEVERIMKVVDKNEN